MAIGYGEQQFNELEKRIIAFKGMFGVYNTTTDKLVGSEFYPKGFQTYPDEILTNAKDILFVNSGTPPVARVRTWITGSGANSFERIANGSFEISDVDPSSTNPFVEKIVMPLTNVGQSNGQFYVCFSGTGSNSTYNKQFTSKNTAQQQFKTSQLIQSQSFILKNFIPPSKFGGAYKANVQQADASYGNQQPNNLIQAINPLGDNFLGHEGYVFDYKEGFLTLGSSGPVSRLDTDNNATYTDYNTAPSSDSGSIGDDGTFPQNFPDGDFKSTFVHPLFITVYRYFGPIGFLPTDPNSPITASSIQTTGDINVGGTINFTDGVTFTVAEAISTSGSTKFGDTASQDTHQFTGSVSISGSFMVNGSETIGTGGGTAGINPILITNSSSLTDLIEYKTNRDYFNKNSVKSTDNNDIVEYIFDRGLFMSASEGETNYIMPLGSASFNLDSDNIFLPPNRVPGDIDTDDRISTIPDSELNAQVNFNKNIEGEATTTDLFRFSASTAAQDFPDLLSYAKFSVATSSYTTHSFGFTSPKVISKIGLYYSNNSSDNPQTDTTFGYVEQVILEGSKDGITYEHIYSESGINQARLDGNIPFKQYVVGTDPEFTPHGSNEDSTLSSGDSKFILNYTSSEFYTGSFDTGFKLYRLYISGGIRSTPTVTEGATPHSIYQHHLHHIDLYENLKFVSGNRKQITIGFDDSADLVQSNFSKFDIRISESFQKLGIVAVPEPESAFFFTGQAQDNVDFNNNDALNIGTANATNLTATNTSLTNLDVTAKATASKLTTNELIVEDKITNKGYLEVNKSLFLTDEFSDVTMGQLPSSSIILQSLHPIYFTTRTINGTVGVDQHSGRIFGHSDGDVNNLYIDGYRLFNIADTEIRFKTHHPTLGKVVVSASKGLQVSGTISASGITSTEAIFAPNFFDLNGAPIAGGAGFPFEGHAQLTGSLSITQSSTDNPHIQLSSIPNELTDIHTANEDAGNILWNRNGVLYWGTVALASPTDTGDVLTNATINTSLTVEGNSIFNGNITASGDISASGLLFASSSDASGQPYLTVLIDTSSGRFYYTGSYGGGGGGGTDNLGNHLATQTLNLQNNSIINVESIGVANTSEFRGKMTVANDISASGHIFLSASNVSDETPSGAEYFVLVQDSKEGKIFRTGSYGSGAGDGKGDLDWRIEDTYLSSSKEIRVKGDISASGDILLEGGKRVYFGSDSSTSLPTFISSPNNANLELRSPRMLFRSEGDETQFVIINKAASFFTSNASIGPSNESMLNINGTLSASNNVYFPGLSTKALDQVVLWDKGSGRLYITGASSLSSTNIIDPSAPYVFDTIHVNDIHVTKSIITKENTIIEGGRAILGISGSIKKAFNNEKLTNYFHNDVRKASLYVRNGATIVGGDILPDSPFVYDIGSKEFPFRDLHLKSSSIVFYSGSDETSGSSKSELARITINESNKVVEFKSGSEFNKIRASEINLGDSVSVNGQGSVQIGQQTQGFIAVNASPGSNSTVLRAESAVLSGNDLVMGSITQKGSGSFAILLDADSSQDNRAKFVVESNVGSPGDGGGTRLFSVSESMETRAYGYLKVNDYITTTNITASNNISASGNVTVRGDVISRGNIIAKGNVVAQNYIISSSITHLTQSFSSGSTIFGDSSDDTHQFTGSINILGDVTATSFTDITASNLQVSGNISSTQIEANRFVAFLGSSYIENQHSNVIIDSRFTTPFISIKGGSGFGATLIRPEETSYGDRVTGGIVQKGSGSFEILLDADITQGDKPHFGIRSNTAVPGTIGTILFTVSESFETRVHNGGLRADNFVTTTNITASGNVSGSYITTASFGSLQLSNLPTSPTGLPTGSVWVSGSKNDASTNNVNCGTLMIVI